MDLLVFDMGHVFIDFEWEVVRDGFRRLSGRSAEELFAVFVDMSKLGYESGRIDTDAFLRELSARLGCQLTREQFTEIWTLTFRENEHMAALLETLKAQRPLYLLSNTNEVHYDWLQSKFNVARHFQELILSYKVGCSKPDPAIYQEVLKRSKMPAEKCLFIDDLEQNVRAAADAGMRTVLFRGVDDLKKRLLEYGLEV